MSQEIHCVSIIETNWLMQFRELIAVYSENHKKGINTFCGQNACLFNVKVSSTYI
jgi:hypothetical protein